MADLFADLDPPASPAPDAPLADRLRPRALAEVVGQEHLTGPAGAIGRMVAAGEWRDYGMSFLREMAVFSVFRRAAENPLYRIEKRPALRLRQGQYAVIGAEGQVLRRGHDLAQVLRVIDRKPWLVE